MAHSHQSQLTKMLLITLALGSYQEVFSFAPPSHSSRRHKSAYHGLMSESASPLRMMSPETTLAEIDSLWQAFPYTAAALVCGFKASAADFVAQSSADNASSALDNNNNAPIDQKRNLAFLLYGVLYQGIAHEYIFNDLYPVWFGTGTEWTVVATKVLFNLLIQTTLVTLPFAYVLKALIADEQSVQTAMQKYIADIQQQGLLIKCFTLWGPIHCMTFTIVPEHWRVTFIAAVSFFWLISLSTISARETPEEG